MNKALTLGTFVESASAADQVPIATSGAETPASASARDRQISGIVANLPVSAMPIGTRAQGLEAAG